jgi:hypothetical protein
MEQDELYKKIVENKEILDRLNLPKPNHGEYLTAYCSRAAEELKDTTLPEDYDGDLFYWLDFDELGDYLGLRFGMMCFEETRWVIY